MTSLPPRTGRGSWNWLEALLTHPDSCPTNGAHRSLPGRSRGGPERLVFNEPSFADRAKQNLFANFPAALFSQAFHCATMLPWENRLPAQAIVTRLDMPPVGTVDPCCKM